MIDNNTPKEEAYLKPGKDNWYQAVASALHLEKTHIKVKLDANVLCVMP